MHAPASPACILATSVCSSRSRSTSIFTALCMDTSWALTAAHRGGGKHSHGKIMLVHGASWHARLCTSPFQGLAYTLCTATGAAYVHARKCSGSYCIFVHIAV